MVTFKDSAGRSWDVQITVGSILRVKGQCGYDLIDMTAEPEPGKGPLGLRITTDPTFFGQILAELLLPQITKAGMEKDAFYDILDGVTTADAFDAFTKELIDFFRLTGRKEQQTVMEKMLQTIIAGAAAIEEKLGAIDEKKIVGRMVDAELGKLFSDLQGSSALTPTT